MYNFFDRIKAPLTDYRKYNPHKKDDDYVDIGDQINNGNFPNEIGSNDIDLPGNLKNSPITGGFGANLLKQSQHIPNHFINPLSLQSSLIPPPPSYGGVTSPSLSESNYFKQSGIFNLRNTVVLPPANTILTSTSPSNVISVPTDSSTEQQEQLSPTLQVLSPESQQCSHVLPHSEIKNNQNNDNDNDYNTLMEQSTQLQIQMQELMNKMKLLQQQQQIQKNQFTSPPLPPPSRLNQSQHLQQSQQFSQSQLIPQPPPHHKSAFTIDTSQLYNNGEHLLPHSKRFLSETAESIPTTTTTPTPTTNSNEIEMNELKRASSIFPITTSNRFGKDSTFYNLNSTTSKSSLEQSTINVDESNGVQSPAPIPSHQPPDVIMDIDEKKNKTIITTTVMESPPLVGDSPQSATGSGIESPTNGATGEHHKKSPLTAIPTSTIRMVIPKIKSKFNKEKMDRFKKGVFQILKPDTSVPIHIVDKDQTDNKVVPFLMELGRALLMSGVPSHRLEFELTLISSTFGLDGHFFTTPTGIFFSFGSPHSILSPYTHFLRINSTDYNMERMIALEELADKVIYGEINCLEALDKLKLILAKPPLYNIYIQTFSFVVSSFAIAFFFNAGWVEVGGCSIIGLYVGLLCWLSSKFSTVGRVLEALSACGGAFIASLFNAYVSPAPIFLLTLGGIIALAPGLGLTLAVAEISTRNLVSGTSRLVGVFASLLQLTFGIALGTKVSELILPLRDEVTPNSFPSWTLFPVIPVAAISFAIQLKVGPKQYWVVIVSSVIGVVAGNWGSEYFGDIGAFFGSAVICILGNLYSRFSNISAVVPIMAGVILLVPGSMGVKGLISVASGDTSSGISFISGMFMVGMALIMGLLVANLVIPPPKSM